jgi:predicted nucleic acid-binding protein
LRTGPWEAIEEVVREPGTDLHVPSLCDVEVAAALRRGLLLKTLSAQRAAEALQDYTDLPLTRHGHLSLLPRIITLRDNFSAYDAAYVALTERLNAELLTADVPLRHAVQTHLPLTVLPQ